MTMSFSVFRARALALAASACLSFTSSVDAGLLISVSTTPTSGTPSASGSVSGNLATSGSDSATLTSFSGTDLQGIINATANATTGNDALQTLIDLSRSGSTAETVTVSVTETFATPILGSLAANNTFTVGLSPGSTPNSVVASINGGSALPQGVSSVSVSGPYSFTEVFTIKFPATDGSATSFTADTVTLTGSQGSLPAPEPGAFVVWSLIACAFGSSRLLRRGKRSENDRF